MKGIKAFSGALIIVIIFLVFSSFFTIKEGYHGILLRLGRIVTKSNSENIDLKKNISKTQLKNIVLDPGLHLKWPFIDTAYVFDTRLQTLDIKSSRIVTIEKKDVIVDYYVKWRIEDLPLYFKATSGDETRAETLLEQQLNTLIRAEFGKRTIQEVVYSDRQTIMNNLIKAAMTQADNLGINVVDARIKGIELPPNTSNQIFERMRANMRIVANEHRAKGEAMAEEIRAIADKKVTLKVAQAVNEGFQLRALGQAQAARIYADAFKKDKQFFKFYRSLKAYKKSFNSKQDLLILDQSSEFFKYFKQPLKSVTK